MKKRILLSLLLLISFSLAFNVQSENADITKTVGPSGADYATLREAFVAINNGILTGAVTLQITGGITDNNTAVLNASGSGSANYTSVNIYPTISGVTLSGSYSGPLINLNGADHVTIDGRVNATGLTVSLVISNASTSNGSNTSTISFTNDATFNIIKYCKLQGSTTTEYDGILTFRNVATTTGNSNNAIDHNEITNAGGNRPRNALFSCGFSEAVMNSSNTVTNNSFYDVLNLNQNWTRAIVLSAREDAHPNNSYSTGWTISGNSFYDTQDFTSSISGSASAIYVWADHGSGFTISNNYIGGNAPLCSGTWTKTTGNIFFTAIFLNAKQAGATNYIQGNTIKNFSYTNSGNYGWYGINFNAGDNNVSNNCIGSSTGTGSIIFTTGSSDGGFTGIIQGVYCSSTVNNNTIGAITVANSNAAYATNFLGIWVSSYCGSGSTSNNLVGSTTTSNSINATSASTSSAQTVVGIKIQGGSTMNILNNTIANLTNGTTNATTSTQGYIYGIYPFQGVNTITGNTIHDLTIANANNGTGPVISTGYPSTSLSAGGIVAPIYNGNNQTLSGNTVYNISNSYSSFTGHVAGIYHYGQSSASSVNGNLIYGLSVSSSSSSANIHGIKIGQGTTTYSNNIIVLGGNTTSTLYGIYDANTSWGYTSNIYFNSVYINGTPASGSLNSFCLYHDAVGGGIRNYKNNILFNARSNSGASGKHYAIYLSGAVSAIDYNDYYVTGTGGVLGYYGGDKTTLADWKTATGQDSHSQDLDPSFASAGGTNAIDYIPSTLLPAATGTGVTTDYGGSTRSESSPEMGAWEKNTALTWTGATSTDWSVTTNWDLGSVPISSSNVSIPSAPSNQPHITQAVATPAACNNLTIDAGAVLTIDPLKALTVNGTLTNSAGNGGLVISSDGTGTGSLIQHSSSVGATVNRYITGSATLTANVYHFVSIPVYYGSPTSNLFLGSYLYKLDAAQVDPDNSNYYGLWVNLGSSTTTPLSCNSGYMIYYPAASHTYTFTGDLNTGSFSPTVSYGGTYTFNLVPNPYPSAIDWGSSGGWVKSNIGATAWIWSASGGNYTTLSGPSYVPAGQAFIVMASGSPVLTMNNNACVHNTQAFYKSAQANTLKVSAQSNGYYDETFVGFNAAAGVDFDPDFDGFKLWGLADAPQLWTEKGTFRLSINQQPPPEGSLIVPLDFKTTYAGEVMLAVSGVDGFDPTLPIRLQDHLTGSMTDLRQHSGYAFTHDPANSEKRFSLVFGYPNGIGESKASEGRAWVGNGNIFVEVPSMHGAPATITVYDITGQVVRSAKKTMNGTVTVEAPSSAGVYIVAVTSEGGQYITRIIKK